MNTQQTRQLDACLDRLVGHLDHLRQLDLSVAADVAHALEASQEVLGTLAMYRGLLQRLEDPAEPSMRQAA